MASEFTPVWSKARMTNAQIKKLQEEQELARKIAETKLAAAKKSDEWKKEKSILKSLENVLDGDNLIVIWTDKYNKKNIEKKELSFLEKIILWFKKLLK